MNRPANIDVANATPVDWRLFTARDFQTMLSTGAFEDMNVELVEGRLERMAPAGMDHANQQLTIGAKLLAAYAGGEFVAGTEVAVKVSNLTVRGADILVARASAVTGGIVEGKDVVLVVEIANTTLARDLGDKVNDYAVAGVGEYWVFDAKAQVVHCFSEPQDGSYRQARVVPYGEALPLPELSTSIIA